MLFLKQFLSLAKNLFGLWGKHRVLDRKSQSRDESPDRDCLNRTKDDMAADVGGSCRLKLAHGPSFSWQELRHLAWPTASRLLAGLEARPPSTRNGGGRAIPVFRL